MGLFSLKRRSKDKSSSPSSPVATPSASTIFALPPTPSSLFRGRLSAPSSPAMSSEQGYFLAPPVQSEPEIPSPPKVTLNVLIDSLSEVHAARLPELAGGVFQISVEEDAEVDEVRYEVDRTLRLRGSLALGCYKVSIPFEAYHQAKSYTAQSPSTPLNLVSHFPSYNLSDPAQLVHSLASPRCSAELSRGVEVQKVSDWWPSKRDIEANEIQVLVRLGQVEADHSSPLTLLAHFAKPSIAHSCAHSSSTHASLSRRPRHARVPSCSSLHLPLPETNDIPRPPVALEVTRGEKIKDILDRLMRADGRPSGVERLEDKVVLWRVDMSWEEMLNCERFGGLRTGDMPWPYPPNAPEPISMANKNSMLSTIFPATQSSNLNLVSLFVYIQPEAQDELARRDTSAIPFCYPPRPVLSPATEEKASLGEDFAQAKLEKRRRRGGSSRPSTAPVVGSTEAVPVFGPRRVIGAEPRTSSLFKTFPSAEYVSPLGQSPLELSNGIHLGPRRAATTTTTTDSLNPSPLRLADRRGSQTSQTMMRLDLKALTLLDMDQQNSHLERDSTEIGLTWSRSRSVSTQGQGGGCSVPVTPCVELAEEDLFEEFGQMRKSKRMML